MKIVVAGCSAALHPALYGAMPEVFGVIGGHDAVELAGLVAPEAPLNDRDEEPIGGVLLERDARGTRGFMKVQDGCDRRCSFCATRLARGKSRSRDPHDLVSEARALARNHREIVITGIHIGHYGLDLHGRTQKDKHSLSKLLSLLLDEVPEARFRLGSVEATEIDDPMIELLETSGSRLVPHLHVPMQAGSDRVLRAMQRWHTREQYRTRILEISARLPYLGLGADIIVGFPGESDEDFEDTRRLVEELPYTYLHVFPYSLRDDTVAASLPDPVPGEIAAERSRILRELVLEKGAAYRRGRVGQGAEIVVEEGPYGLTEDYLRVRLQGDLDPHRGRLLYLALMMEKDELVARIA